MQEPLERFSSWIKEARDKDNPEPDAAALATYCAEEGPDVRMVLVKAYDQRGFVFYTNLKSVKSQHLRMCPKAALCFYWKSMSKQIRIRGTVHRLTPQEDHTYFAQRSRESRIAACLSRQSELLPSEDFLRKAWQHEEKKWHGKDILCPSFWGGWRVHPKTIEFWEMGAHRIHTRILYQWGTNKQKRLFP